jgi:hypothetical protein
VAEGEPVIKEIYIEATPQEIFAYLTDSDKYVLSMGLAAQIIDRRCAGERRLHPEHRPLPQTEHRRRAPSSRVASSLAKLKRITPWSVPSV